MANKLMIVAHPDDESLFGGGQLITEDHWKVVCVTNGNDPIRRDEFEMVMYVTDSEFEMWSYKDEYSTPLDRSLEHDLRQILTSKKWDKVLTHNEYGEYGHPHHKQIFSTVFKILGDSEFWTFNFSKKAPLPDPIWQEKLNLIEIYKSQKEICKDHIPYVRNETIVKNRILL